MIFPLPLVSQDFFLGFADQDHALLFLKFCQVGSRLLILRTCKEITPRINSLRFILL
jgi:hypothetical protein